MKIAIHQPNYFPWIGYFHKILKSDMFVFLDNVEYTPGFINRNRIKTKDGWIWLTVPIIREHSSHTNINEIKIDNSKKWKKRHWNSIQTYYGGTEHFKEFKTFFNEFYSTDWKDLSAMNIFAIKELSKILGIESEFVKSSDIEGIQGTGTELLVNLCKKLGVDEYISGEGGKDYMELDKFESGGIKISFQKIEYPTHKQMFSPPFVKNLSIIDVVLNEGHKTLNILKGL